MVNKIQARRNTSLASLLLGGSAFLAIAALSSTVAFGQAGQEVETVTSTGTIFRNAAPVGANVITVGQDAIQQIGAVTVSQVLADIPGLNNFGSAGQGAQNSSDPGGASSPTIHSLGNSASNGTLILVDGHRLPTTGIQHNTIDPSAVPVIALQRVEVLPDGASATYGSDAVAGVINFITRKNYTGIEAQAQYSFADNYSNYTAAILAGHEWDGGSALVAYQYVYKTPLANGTRSYQTARQDLRLGQLANPTAFASAISATPPTGFQATTPDNTHGTSGPYGATVPYPSLGSNFQNFQCPIAAIRASNNSTSYLYPYASSTAVVNNITNFNGVCDEVGYGSWLPSENRQTFFASFKQQLGNVQVTLDVDYSSRLEGQINARGTFNNAIAFGPSYTGTLAGQTTPSGSKNPFYQSGSTSGTNVPNTFEQVSYDFTPLLADEPLTREKTGDTVAFANFGVDWNITPNWLFSVGATFGTDFDFDRTNNALCVACALLALNGTTNVAGTPNDTVARSAIIDPAGLGTIISETRALNTGNALDVWDPVASNKTSQAVKDQLVSGFNNTTATQGINDISAQLQGPLFALPGGDMKIAVGGEFTDYTDRQQQNTSSSALGPSSVSSQTVNLYYGRTVWAAFAELQLPLVGPDMNIPLMQKFVLDVAGRVDAYTTYGTTKNPKLSFSWDMIDGLRSRGSFGTSFTVPAFASGGQNKTGLTSQSGVNLNGAPTIPVPFNDTTYNGGAGVAGTFVASATTCAAAGSTPVDANGANLAAPYTGAVACRINTTNTQGLQYAAGGKPGLKPEIGMTYSFGFDWDAGKWWSVLHGLTGEVTFYQAKYAGLVTSIGLSTSQPGLTYFAPPGGWSPTDPFITSRLQGYPLNTTVPSPVWYFFDGRQTNAYNLWQNGLDYGVHYGFDTDYGAFTWSFSGNEIFRFTQQNLGPNQPLIDIKNGKAGSSGRFAGQEMTWRSSLGWFQDPYRVQVAFNYQSPYYASVTAFPYNLAGPVRPANLEKIEPLFTVDLNVGYTMPDFFNLGMGGTQLDISVSNLLDT
ncbi:MAG: TonB-dependent receptor, partial [Alphaproteobacteria bacterium]|nr:TonB-dependent receptor [Alphaproteobacteria bacterium]